MFDFDFQFFALLYNICVKMKIKYNFYNKVFKNLKDLVLYINKLFFSLLRKTICWLFTN